MLMRTPHRGIERRLGTSHHVADRAGWSPRSTHVPHRASPLERLATTIVSCDRLEDLLPELARQLAASVEADLAVIRLREGDRLVTQTAIGFRGERETGYTHRVDPFAQRAAESGPIMLAPGDLDPAQDDALVSAAIAAEDIHAICVTPLRSGPQLEGLVLLGWRVPTTLDDDRAAHLTSLVSPIGPALVRLRAIGERDAAIAAAERALALRDEVLGVVAHDLRNPLNVITTAVELMQGRATDPAQRRHLDRIMRGVQRAERLVRDLLEVNAIEGSGLTIEKRRVEVVEVVLSAIDSQQVLTASASVVLGTDLAPALPAVAADELRLQEVLENLISNAVKFTPAGGTVIIGAAPHPDGLRIWVRDSGAGIAPEHLPHVFDRFWQGVKHDRRGAGLGLAICRAIIDAHGGRIWAESGPAGGTTLSFTLPLAPALPQVTAPPAASILLVDDRPENLLALSAILDHPAYRIVTARSGEEALREALREDFLVALIDVAMPGMDGFEVAGHLKRLSRYHDIPIIFVTAFGDDPQEVHRAYAAGGADYIVKPLDSEVVRKKVAVFVELAQRLRATPRAAAS